MSRRKTYRVHIQDKRVYALDVEAYDNSGAKDLARDIFQHQGFASGVVVELLSNACCEIVGVSEKTNESSNQ